MRCGVVWCGVVMPVCVCVCVCVSHLLHEGDVGLHQVLQRGSTDVANRLEDPAALCRDLLVAAHRDGHNRLVGWC